uniref:POU domain, class 2, transcription factor 3 n=1 Tax=Phallusia mammillata TaxID=59560 RepID=A0A6F9DPX5_9ASCI|nr:POU domain, class 2, transcription factor 3 [Phallusia mammillata]
MSTSNRSQQLKRKLDYQEDDTMQQKDGIPVVKLMRIDGGHPNFNKWFDKNVKSEMKEPTTDELIQFSIDFRRRRKTLGLTRENFVNATTHFDHCVRSVAMLEKFEGLDLQISCAMSYYPYLCLWIDLAEASKSKGEKEFVEFLSGTKLRRKHQKCFLPTQQALLNKSFNNNPIPSADDVNDLVLHIGCNRKSILDWFARKKREQEKIVEQRIREEKHEAEMRIRKKLKEEKLRSTERRYRISHMQTKIDEITKKTSHEEESFKGLFPNRRKATKKKNHQIKHPKSTAKKNKESTIKSSKNQRKQSRKNGPIKKQALKFDHKIALLKQNSLKTDKSFEAIIGRKLS